MTEQCLSIAALVASVACALGLVGLMIAERKKRRGLRIAFKSLASTSFVLLGAILISGQPANAYSSWIFVGLVLGAIGDITLLMSTSRAFLIGLGSFLVGHIAYLLACNSVVSMSAWMSVFALVPIALAVLALLYLWPHLASMKKPVILYVVAIVSMVVGAIAVFQHSPTSLDERQELLLLSGAALFFLSDFSVALSRFVSERNVHKLWGHPAYYIGQLCMAWSMAPL